MSNGRVTPTRRYESGETSQKSGNRKAGGRLVWRCNNKLGSLWQSNSVWCVANWTSYAHLCLRYFGRGFSYARDLESLHAICAVVESFVAANRHAGQVGYSHNPPQEVRHEKSGLRADPSEKGEGQAAHAAACAAGEREHQSNLPVLWRFTVAVLHLAEAL